MDRGAEISEGGKYRYRLWRKWDDNLPLVLFVGLNPSTADYATDDPTILKLIGIAQSNGFGGMLVGNLFAYRSTDFNILKTVEDPVGIENDQHLFEMMLEAEGNLVAMWGDKGKYRGRDDRLRQMYPVWKCLGITKKGNPTHPLFLRKDTQLVPLDTSFVKIEEFKHKFFRVETPFDMFSDLGRIVLLLSDFKNTFNKWPSKLIIYSETYGDLKNNTLTPIGFQHLEKKVEIIMASDWVMVAIDDETQSLAYKANRNLEQTVTVKDAIEWLGLEII